MVKATTAAFRAQAEVRYLSDGIPALRCNIAMSDQLKQYANELLGKNYVAEEPFQKVGSEDFAHVCERIPGGYFFLGAGPDEHSVWPYGQHNPRVLHNESVLYKGAAVEAQCAARWLEDAAAEGR